jgi:hypothetical protein
MCRVSVDGGVPSLCAQTHSTIPRYGRILGYRPSRQQPGRLEHIDLPANDFVLLAAIGPILRQFSLVSGLHTNDAVSARELPMTIEHAKLNQS